MLAVYHSDLSFILFVEISCVFLQIFAFELEETGAVNFFEGRSNSGSFV